MILKLVTQLSKEMGRTVILISENPKDLHGADAIYQISDGVIDKYGKGVVRK